MRQASLVSAPGAQLSELPPREDFAEAGSMASAQPPMHALQRGHEEGNAVVGFLERIGLPMYTQMLLTNGVDDLGKLETVEVGELMGMGIPTGHVLLLRRKLFELHSGGAAETPRPAAGPSVAAFLSEAGVGRYAAAISAAGIDDMETLLLVDERDLKDLGMQRGHIVKLRRRLRAYAAQRYRTDAPPAPPVPPAPPALHVPPTPLVLSAATPPEAPCHEPPSSPASHGVAGSGLSALERSWKTIEALGTGAVAEVLLRHTVALAPSVAAMFPPEVRSRYQEWTAHEKDESRETDVRKSPALRRIFTKIINAVGCTVAGLQDMHELVPMVVKLGVRHYHYGVSEEHLHAMSVALDMTLQDVLGAAYTPEVRHAWATVFGLLSSLMSECFRQLGGATYGLDKTLVNIMRLQPVGAAEQTVRSGSGRRNVEAMADLQAPSEEEQQAGVCMRNEHSEEPEAELPLPDSPESHVSLAPVVALDPGQ